MASNMTQDKIIEAFKKLLEGQSFSTIKVTAIVTTAGVSHMSFYRKYADKYALLEEICYDDFVSFAKIYGRNATWKEVCVCLFNCVKNNRQFYRKIFVDDHALEVAVQAAGRVSSDFTGGTISEYTGAIWKIVLRNWARNNMAESVGSVVQTLLEHLPISDVMNEQERRNYLGRYEGTTMQEFPRR